MRERISRHLSTIVDERVEASARTGGVFALLGRAVRGTSELAPSQSPAVIEPVRPPELSWRDYTIFLLQVAAEIEHSLMVQYLYAAYSLGGSQVPQHERHKVSQWQQVILGIAKEEMGHLVTVQNLLTVLGGPPNFDREDYPYASGFYPFDFTLEPVTRDSLAKYIYTEMPEVWDEEGSDAIKKRALKAVSGRPINRVGKLYGTIDAIIKAKDKGYLLDRDFLDATVPFQASWDEWGRGYRRGARAEPEGPEHRETPDLLIPTISSRSQAAAALEAVMEQGESPSTEDDKERSHFRRFLAIYKEFPEPLNGWTPTRPVPTNPRIEKFGNERAALWAHLLNLRYRMLLTGLSHAFHLSSIEGASGRTPRGFVIARTFGEMYFLRAISETLVGIPIEDGGDAAKAAAGPTFDLPYSMKLPLGEPNRWRLHRDLIDAAQRLASSLGHGASETENQFLRAMQDADTEALDVVTKLIG